MDNPKISIIVPVFNAEKYLERCLNSLVCQTFKDIEVIVLDDCSTDNSVEIIEGFKKKTNTLHLIKSEVNCGSGAIRNRGVQRAKGKYIMFVDSDDWIDTKACKILYSVAEKHSAEIVVGKYNKAYDKGSKIATPELHRESKVYSGISFMVQNEFTSQNWDKFWLRKFFIENNLRFEEGRYFQDVSMTCVGLLAAKRVVNIDYRFYYYYLSNKTSVTRMVPTEKHLNDRLWVLSYFMDKIQQYSNTEAVKPVQRLLSKHIRAGLSNLRKYNGNDQELPKILLQKIQIAIRKTGIEILKIKKIPILKRILIFISPKVYLKVYGTFDKLKRVFHNSKL